MSSTNVSIVLNINAQPTCNTGAEVSMTTREIAELTGKQHSHVMRDCREMFSELGLVESTFGSYYICPLNRERLEYKLDKELTMTLVSGYNTKLRNRIVKRVLELEGDNAYDVARELAKDSTKTMSELVEEANSTGSENQRKYCHKHHNDLINKLATGMTTKQLRELRGEGKKGSARDFMTADELSRVSELTERVRNLAAVGMTYAEIKVQLPLSLERKPLKQQLTLTNEGV